MKFVRSLCLQFYCCQIFWIPSRLSAELMDENHLTLFILLCVESATLSLVVKSLITKTESIE
jgi:hypothetical protein